MAHYLYLAHHGIKGQQWGVKNGPPYPLDDSSQKQYKKRTSDMTDAELQQALNRLRNEQAYQDLLKKQQETKKQETSQKKISDMTDQELQNYVNRLRNEKAVKDITNKKAIIFLEAVAGTVLATFIKTQFAKATKDVDLFSLFTTKLLGE